MLTNILTLTALSLVIPTLSTPIPQLGQLIPDLPAQADLSTAQVYVASAITTFSGTYNDNRNHYGELINSYIPVANTLDSVIGRDNVIALDVLADRACIAAADQGSLCNELLSYAYAWYIMQTKGKTGKEMATILGPNNMRILANDLRVLCLSENSQKHGNEQYELCQLVAFDADNIANSIIDVSDNNNAENAGNSNSLEYFGLANLLPTPTTIV